MVPMKASARIACAMLVAAGACAPKPPPPPPPPTPRVTVAHPEEREIFDSHEFGGWLQAPESVDVRARVRGHIAKVHFTDGQFVKKGDALFTLDERPFQAELDRAIEEQRIYDAQRLAAEKDLVRHKDLIGTGGTSQSLVDKIEADVGALTAHVESGKQEVVRRRLELAYASITAPIAGRTGRALLTEGNFVNAGGTDPVLTTIVAVDPIHLYFYVAERDLQEYRAARRKIDPEAARKTLRELKVACQFALETETGFPHEGMLDFSDNRIDPETGTIQVRGIAPNPDLRFIPGARVRVRVPTSLAYHAVLVPEAAISTDQDRKYVLLVGPNDIVLRKDVELGKLLENGERVIVSEGKVGSLSKDDLVIVLGLQRARVNYPVEPFDQQGNPVRAR